MPLTQDTVLFTPEVYTFKRKEIHFLVDPEFPHWIATDARGASLIRMIDGKKTYGEVAKTYAEIYRLEAARAWFQVHHFFQEAVRFGMVSNQPFSHPPYTDRTDVLKLGTLSEFWIHTNNSCNLDCVHCLVESEPGADPGLATDQIRSVIDQARQLGASRFYFTGGEPFLRRDIFDLIRHIIDLPQRCDSNIGLPVELIILTNATLFEGDRLVRLDGLDRSKVKMQISLDGTTESVNDPIRGAGTYRRILAGISTLKKMGFETSLTAVVTESNLRDLPNFPVLAREAGVRSLRLMWPYYRGRAWKSFRSLVPSVVPMIEFVREVKRRCDQMGILLDNYEWVKLRADSRPGTKYDLNNACWNSLCLFSDGHLYPSAALAGHPMLDLGDALRNSLKPLWMDSPVAQQYRRATMINRVRVSRDHFHFLIGGRDMEHAYLYTESRKGMGDFHGVDPYYPLSVAFLQDAMEELAVKGLNRLAGRSGQDLPVIYHTMGEETMRRQVSHADKEGFL